MSTIRGCVGLLSFLVAGLIVGACEVPAPELPEAPEAPEEAGMLASKGGNCCIRNGKMLETKCNGAPCCVPKLDEEQCEKAKGFWFFSSEGCAGAC